MPVPARGWTAPVRVCNSCKDILSKKRDARPGKYRIVCHSINVNSKQFLYPFFKLRDVHNPNQLHSINTTKCAKDVTQPTINSPAGAYNGVNPMTDDQDIRVRKYGEVVYNTLTSVASVLEYPKGVTQSIQSQNKLNI